MDKTQREFFLSRRSLMIRAAAFLASSLIIVWALAVKEVSSASAVGLSGLGLGILAVVIGIGELVWKAFRPAVWINNELVRLHVFLGRSVQLRRQEVSDLRVEGSGGAAVLKVRSGSDIFVAPIRLTDDPKMLQQELRELLGIAGDSDSSHSSWASDGR